MLPHDRPLSKSEIDQVATDLKEFREREGLSLEAISKSMGAGFSPQVLSAFERSRMRGDYDRVARGINAFIEQRAASSETARPHGFVETEVAKKILTVARTVHASGSMGVVFGSAGNGKTMTARVITDVMPGTLYFRVKASVATGPAIGKSLATMLSTAHRSSHAITIDLIIAKLRGSRRLIIVDEAQRLKPSGWETWRDIHDETGCPVLFIGTIDVHSRVNDTDAFYGQYSSRVIATLDIDGVLSSGRRPTKPLFSTREIREVFESDKLRLTDDGAQYLAELACVPGLGGLRTCDKLVALASRMKGYRTGKALDRAVLNTVLREMHGDVYIALSRSRREQLKIRVA